MRRRPISFLALGARPRPAAPAGARGAWLDHPPRLERRLVSTSAGRAREDRGGGRWRQGRMGGPRRGRLSPADRKSVVSGKSVSVRVDPGGRRNIKKKKQKIQYE